MPARRLPAKAHAAWAGTAPGACGKSGLAMLAVVMGMILLAGVAGIGLSELRDRMVREGIEQAVAGLASMREQMDSHRRTHGTFATVASARSPCEADESARTFGPFVVRCAYPPGPSTFMLHAVGRNAVADFAFTLDQAGRRTTLSAPEGWPRCPGKWAVRKDASC